MHSSEIEISYKYNIVSFICWTRTHQCYNLRQQLILFLGLVESYEVILFEHSSLNFRMRKVLGLCMLCLKGLELYVMCYYFKGGQALENGMALL